MGRKIKDCDYYVNRIIKLRAGISKTMVWMSDAEHRRHNRNSRELYKLEDEDLYDNVELATEVYGTLMKSEDPDLRQHGATCSLIMRINIEEAVQILEWCVENREAPYSGGARRRLMMFRGQIPEDTPRRPPKSKKQEE